MLSQEEQQRDKYFKEFGRHLAQQHRRTYLARHQRQPLPGNSAAVQFGRYLCAARRNAGHSAESLAAAAQISLATLHALELGLCPADSIKPVWLTRLAAALNENVADFWLLLGWPANPAKPRWPVIHWPRIFRAGTLFGPGFATVSAMLLWVVVGVALFFRAGGATVPLAPTSVAAIPVSPKVSAPVEAPAPHSTLVPVDVDTRLNLVKAERQKVLLQNISIINFGDPLIMPPDYEGRGTYFLANTATNIDDSLPMVYAFDFFNNPVLVLWALTNYTPGGRFNISNAEYGLENQVLVPPPAAANPDNRLNMVKAETLL